jgi:GH25 family lysozyme M1 (1,4-beta-N-acetylmuramidase)
VDDTWADNLLWLKGGISFVLDCGDAEPTFVFGHLNSSFFEPGDWVEAGTLIGYTGNTGMSSGPHLHFEALLPGYILASSTYGRTDPRKVCSRYWNANGNGLVREVTVEGTKVRTAPWTNAPSAPGYEDGLSAGAQISVVGYAKGEAVIPGNDAWYKTKSGFYVWANNAGDNIEGLKYFGEVARPADPAPAPAPAPTPPPAPEPTPPPVAPPAVLAPGYLNGVDVASYQETADLSKLPADFIIVKATEGGGGWKDPSLNANTAEARAGAKRIGFYHFARFAAGPENTAEAEARSFIEAVRPLIQAGDIVALDVETFTRADGTVEDPTKDTEKIYRWLDLVRTELRTIPLVYLNGTAINGADWTKVEAEFPLWYASYSQYSGPGYSPKNTPAGSSWGAGIACLQYTSSGRLDGYGSDIDLNVWFQVAEWDRIAVKAAPTPPPAPKPSGEEVFRTLLAEFGDQVLTKLELTTKE